jgi:hypothetical protein
MPLFFFFSFLCPFRRCLRRCRPLLAVNPNNKNTVASHGGINAIINVMAAHRADVEVQHRGAWVLMRLSVDNNIEVQVGAAGGIQTLVAALKAHPTSYEVAHRALWGLTNLSAATVNKPCVCEAGPHILHAPCAP